jgi:hypothetical protein
MTGRYGSDVEVCLRVVANFANIPEEFTISRFNYVSLTRRPTGMFEDVTAFRQYIAAERGLQR